MKSQLQKANQVQIGLLKIEQTCFFLNTSPLTHTQDFNSDNLQIEFEFKIDTDISNDLFCIEIIARYIYKTNNEQVKVLEMGSNNQFKVFDLINLIDILPNDKITDKAGFLPTLISISISSLRGMLVIKTLGTVLADYPIPIVDPVSLIQNALVPKP